MEKLIKRKLQVKSTQWDPHCDSATPFSSHTKSLLGAVMQAGLMLLSKPRAVEFGSPSPERANAAKIAQRPKIRQVRPRPVATTTPALGGGTGHIRGAPMPRPQRCRWTCTGSPGASPSRRPACAGTR